jgi:hypothetical protein
MTTPLEQLGIRINMQLADRVAFDLRQPIMNIPGDYFRYPYGADTMTISPEASEEITSTLHNSIKKAFYDSSILGALKGLRYRLYGQDSTREEYHIRYAQGDTIYVISGWLGKFLSFYRSVPGFIKFDLKELQDNVSRVAASDIKIPKEAYEKSSRDNPYFIEYVNHEAMYRIRCYHIGEMGSMGGNTDPFFSKPYTLIEITKFLDKEVMP